MLSTKRAMRSMTRWLFIAGAALAIVSQVAVTFAAFADGRDQRSAASHVERDGTSTHYAHNDATCVICQARSLTGLTERASAGAPLHAAPSLVLAGSASHVATHDTARPKNPRAPPVPAEA